MARPIKRRYARSYTRDVEYLSRLRITIQLDKALDREVARKAMLAIDGLTDALAELIPADALLPPDGEEDEQEARVLADTG